MKRSVLTACTIVILPFIVSCNDVQTDSDTGQNVAQENPDAKTENLTNEADNDIKYETFADEPADMDDSTRTRLYCREFGIEFDSLEKQDVEVDDFTFSTCASIYFRDSLRRISADAYFNYLSKRVPNKYEMNKRVPFDETNVKQRTFGVYENMEFKPDGEMWKRFLSLPYICSAVYTSIARVGPFYVLTYYTPTDCNSMFGVVSADNELRLVDKKEYEYVGCISPLFDEELPDYIHVDTLNDNIIYPDPEAYNNPEVIVSENGDVTTVFPTEYLVRELHGELLKQVVLADTMWYKIDTKGKFQLIRKHNTPHTPESVMNEYFR